MVQQQFLEVLDPGEAERRWHSVIDLTPLSAEIVAIDEALGRVMAEDIRAAVDVPPSTVRTWMGSRSVPKTRMERWKRSQSGCV